MPAPGPDPRDAPRRVLDDESLLGIAVQPVLDLLGGAVAGWEALSRPAPGLGTDPRALFDDAERAGLGAELHVVALRAALELRSSVPPDTFLTVNVDPRALVEPVVLRAIGEVGDLRGVFVEVTEQDWPDDETAVLRAVAALQEQGALIAMDDVGAGYAGLTRTLRVRPQLIKLDRDLIADLGRDPAARAVVRAVGALAATLDAWLLVEGVEREDQLAAAVREGVPLGQGFLLGRPAPPWPSVDAGPLRRLVSVLALDDAVVSLQRPPESFSVVRDDAGRPVRVAHPQPDGSVWHHPAMTMAPSTPVDEALERALARCPADRFSPLLVTSREGVLLGGVLVEDLVAAVTRVRTSPVDAVPRQPEPPSWGDVLV